MTLGWFLTVWIWLPMQEYGLCQKHIMMDLFSEIRFERKKKTKTWYYLSRAECWRGRWASSVLGVPYMAWVWKFMAWNWDVHGHQNLMVLIYGCFFFITRSLPRTYINICMLSGVCHYWPQGHFNSEKVPLCLSGQLTPVCSLLVPL